MRNIIFSSAVFALLCGAASGQTRPSPTPSPDTTTTTRTQTEARSTATTAAAIDLTAYGVRIAPEPRLIVVMAALEAAGFDPTPAGREPSLFRQQVRRDQADLNAELRARLRAFYERNKLRAPATPAEQAARYVSLVYALGPAPGFESPARTDDLPAGLLDVLDFAPLMREFYKEARMDERLPAYLRYYQAEGERLRRPAADVIRAVVSYLHTQPQTTVTERVPVKSPTPAGGRNKNQQQQQRYTVREHERRFFIVPDLLSPSGAINFRIIGDDYYAVVPPGIDLAASELRRAYLQYMIDPLVLRFSRDISARREPLKALLTERTNAGATAISPDVFLAVARSLVAASDARLEELARLDALARETRARLNSNGTSAQEARERIVKESQQARAAIADEAVAQLAESYERGAVLAFFFAEQLRGVESSGFDIASSFADMIASFDPPRESRRPAEYAAARTRSLAARQARLAERAIAATETVAATNADSSRRSALVNKLVEVDQMLRVKNYTAAEERLRALLQEYPNEARIYFALAQVASLSAEDATDEDVQSRRLNNALTNYRSAVERSSVDADRALVSRAHEAMGRILEFLERKDEALKEFEATIQLGEVAGGAYTAAVAGKNRLARSPQP